MAAIDEDERMGHGQAQDHPALHPRAVPAAAAITSGLVAREPAEDETPEYENLLLHTHQGSTRKDP